MVRLLVLLTSLVLALAACSKAPAPGKTEAPQAPAPGATESRAGAAETPPAPTTVPDPGPAPDAPLPPTEAEETGTVNRDALARCYTAVYCAQKKGEMSRILSLYKEHGFETPQAFTKAWIEAAKDTEWVTRMAYDVSKKCP